MLKRHENLYHNPTYVPPKPKEKTHVCPTCTRQFRHKGNLIRHMSFHDPDSKTRETAEALKAGRMTRIQLVDGKPVEIFFNEDEPEYEDELDEPADDIDEQIDENSIEMEFVEEEDEKVHKEEVVAVGEDGRYMVVEFINVEGEGENLSSEEYILTESK